MAVSEDGVKLFQRKYALSNKEMAEICQCSLPTIQKWRSGEVQPSGAARQLMRFLDHSAEGDPARLREVLTSMNHGFKGVASASGEEMEKLETSINEAVDRLELMLQSRRQEKQLAESEARYKSMVESSNSPICRWLPDTTLTFVNKAYSELFCKFGGNLVGRKWIDFVPRDRRLAVLAIVNDVVRRGEPDTSMHESLDAAGKIRYQEWNDFPVFDENQQVVEFHSIGTDVTELVTLRTEVNELVRARQSLMGLCDRPLLIFDDQGVILDENAAFTTMVRKGADWKQIREMVPELTDGRRHKILRRVEGASLAAFRCELGGRFVVLKIRHIRGQGTQAHYLCQFDLDEPSFAEKPAFTHVASDFVVAGASRPFLKSASQRDTIASHVERTGKINRVDRIYMFSIDHEAGRFDNLLEWCAEGLKEGFAPMKRLPIKDFTWWIGKLLKGQTIQIDDSRKLPRTARQIAASLEGHGIQSIVSLPIWHQHRVAGFVSFAQTMHIRAWHQQELRELEKLRETLERPFLEVLDAAQKS